MPEQRIDWSQCQHVESVPNRVSGAWVIKGTRVPAQAVVDNAKDGFTAEQIATEIFELPIERVRGVLRFAKIASPSLLPGHDVRTVPEMGWTAFSNGQLLDEAERAGFDAIVTGDQNFVTQQSLTGRSIAVVVLSTKRWATIRAHPQRVQRAVATASPGTFNLATFARPRRSPRPPAPTC